MVSRISRLAIVGLMCVWGTACASISSVNTIRGEISEIFSELGGHEKRITSLEKNVIELTLANDTLFKTGSASLSETSAVHLQMVTGILKDHPGVYILIGGHTDNTGPDDLNMKLSKARADAVANALIESGFPTDHIQTVGYGSSSPIASNASAEGRGLNRRVNILISEKKEDLSARQG